jgi:predicted chitinase
MGYMPFISQYGFVKVSGLTEKEVMRTIAHELGHGAFGLKHTFTPEYGIDDKPQTPKALNLMGYSEGTHLAKFQWDIIHDSKAGETEFENSEEVMASSRIIDDKHTKLFEYVYTKNLAPYSSTATASYKTEEWPAAWTYGDDKPEELVNTVIDKLKKATSGSTVPKITLRDYGIYIGKHTVGGKEYATAVYSRKKEITDIKKVVITALDSLNAENIKKHLYCEHAYVKYLVIAFYEEGEQEPALIIQAAKNELELFTSKHLEAWMRYIGVMEEEHTEEDGFHCHECGKDLTITHQDLMKVFPNSVLIKENQMTGAYFQTAFEKAMLNGCYRIAHLLAQVNHESNGMQETEEILDYSLIRLLNIFNTTSTAKMFFKQSFWDDKEYLKYAVKDIYEMVDTTKSETGDYDALVYTTYKYNNSNTDTIRIPVSFTLNKGKGLYKKVILTDDEKQENKERWVNQVYGRSSLGNGGPETGDGYKYRGRGAIQLTGKDNYKRVGEKCNQLFGTSYNWVTDPDMVANDLQANIHAAIGYILVAFSNLSLLDGTDVSAVTLKINSKGLGLPERQAKFDILIQTKYKCK